MEIGADHKGSAPIIFFVDLMVSWEWRVLLHIIVVALLKSHEMEV